VFGMCCKGSGIDGRAVSHLPNGKRDRPLLVAMQTLSSLIKRITDRPVLAVARPDRPIRNLPSRFECSASVWSVPARLNWRSRLIPATQPCLKTMS
jgi:hypothetical protein